LAYFSGAISLTASLVFRENLRNPPAVKTEEARIILESLCSVRVLKEENFGHSRFQTAGRIMLKLQTQKIYNHFARLYR